jgi:hypothetical protein
MFWGWKSLDESDQKHANLMGEWHTVGKHAWYYTKTCEREVVALWKGGIHECTMPVPEPMLSNNRHFWWSHAVSHSVSSTIHRITYIKVLVQGKFHWRASVNSSSEQCVMEQNARYRSMMRKIKGRYRVIIYMHFTLLQCDRSKNVHCAQHIVGIKPRCITEQTYLFM